MRGVAHSIRCVGRAEEPARHVSILNLVAAISTEQLAGRFSWVEKFQGVPIQ
jgi:hypothetical protein